LKDLLLLYKISAAVKRAHAFLLILLVPAALHGQADPLAWLNGIRRQAGAPAVSRDALLSQTAEAWAARLAGAGILSHRGDDGSTALDRYRALGGTEVRVGEILGAGPDLLHVERGWMASAEHRQLAILPAWTHAGWGSAVSGSSQVTVMMFTVKHVEDLLIAQDLTDLTVSGRLVPSNAKSCLLLNGLQQVLPSAWDAASRRFFFTVSSGAIAGYLRLGFVASDGGFTLTNAFTWPPGTGSPEAQGRFSPPAPSP
jgi:hypothetical protein